jgi:hypothetical protein
LHWRACFVSSSTWVRRREGRERSWRSAWGSSSQRWSCLWLPKRRPNARRSGSPERTFDRDVACGVRHTCSWRPKSQAGGGRFATDHSKVEGDADRSRVDRGPRSASQSSRGNSRIRDRGQRGNCRITITSHSARRGSKEHLHRCRVTFGTADVLTGVAKRRRCGAQGFDALVDNAGDGCCDGAVFDPPGGRSETALHPNIASPAARSRWPSCKRSTRALAPFASIN